METLSALGVLVKMTVASYSLNLAAEKAVEVVEMTCYPTVSSLVSVTGLAGLVSLLACFGLGLAFLSAACGTAAGSGGVVLITKRQVKPVVGRCFVGLAIFLGCGLGGALLGSTSITLVALGLRGLFIMGLTVSLTLLFLSRRQKQTKATATAMLSFLALVFMTVLLGVSLGMRMSGCTVTGPCKAILPSLLFIVLLLLPAACVLISLAEKAFGKHQRNFGFLVAASGLLLGLGAYQGGYYPYLVFYKIFYSVRSAVYIVEILTGLVGAALGAVSLSALQENTAEGLSVWISVPAAVILHNLHVDMPDTGLHGLIGRCLGAGAEVGLLLGLAGAAGVSMGCAVQSAGPFSLWKYAVLVFGLDIGAFYKELFTLTNFVVSMVLALALVMVKSTQAASEHQSGRSVFLSLEAAESFAALGVVMMGAMVLGAAGLLTAALGEAGFYGMILAAVMAVIKAVNVSQ